MTRRGPQRSCDGCRTTMDKRALLRLVGDDDGVWWPDLRQKAPGRGRYLCLRSECLRRLNDRRVQRLFGTQRDALLARIADAVGRRIVELMHRLKGRSLPGREAVTQALWNRDPLLVVVAEDASTGLVDRIAQAVQKHRADQEATLLVRAGRMAEYGAIYDRAQLAVVAWGRDGLTDRLMQLIGWQQQLGVREEMK